MKNKLYKCSNCGNKIIELEGFGGIFTYCDGCNSFTEYEPIRYLTEKEEAEYQKKLENSRVFSELSDFANSLN